MKTYSNNKTITLLIIITALLFMSYLFVVLKITNNKYTIAELHITEQDNYIKYNKLIIYVKLNETILDSVSIGTYIVQIKIGQFHNIYIKTKNSIIICEITNIIKEGNNDS